MPHTHHTPAPWIIHKSKFTFAIQSGTAPHAGLIAHVYAKGDLSPDQSSYSRPEEAAANAKVIAAAPDMLLALREIADFSGDDAPRDRALALRHIFKITQEIIAQAEGLS